MILFLKDLYSLQIPVLYNLFFILIDVIIPFVIHGFASCLI